MNSVDHCSECNEPADSGHKRGCSLHPLLVLGRPGQVNQVAPKSQANLKPRGEPVAKPVFDFNKDIDLPRPADVRPGFCGDVRLSFDGAEYRGRVWFMEVSGPNENWVAIEGPENARKAGEALIAWADAYTGPPACEHEWVDARNQVVKSGEICAKGCGAIRSGNIASEDTSNGLA